MSKQLLLIAWEYPGVTSKSGAALARRIGQVAQGFDKAGWKVTVLHKDHIGESTAELKGKVVSENIIRYAIPASPLKTSGNLLIQKLSTLVTALKSGDKTTKEWADNAINFLKNNLQGYQPDMIIAFYTPRGPLAVGNWAAEYFNAPWIADIQDPLSQGSDKFLLKDLVYSWTKKITKSAKAVVHISPEWATETATILSRNVSTIRHAIPEPIAVPTSSDKKEDETVNILYAGSLHSAVQNPIPFFTALNEVAKTKKNIVLSFAMNEATFLKIDALIKSHKFSNINYKWLGWLDSVQLDNVYKNSDLFVLIPWHSKDRVGVPSKLYEYCAYNKPILIAGNDSGGVASLLNEWGHKPVIYETASDIEKVLNEVALHNFSSLLSMTNCNNNVLYEKDLADHYLRLMTDQKI